MSNEQALAVLRARTTAKENELVAHMRKQPNGMTVKDIAAHMHLGIERAKKYGRQLLAQKRIYIAEWRPCDGTLGQRAQVFRVGNLPNVKRPKAKPRTLVQRQSRARRRKADPEQHAARLDRANTRRRKPPKPDLLLAAFFGPAS